MSPLPRRLGPGQARASLLPLEEISRIREDAFRVSGLAEAFTNPIRGQILMLAAQYPGLTISDLASLTEASLSLVSLYVTQLKANHWLIVDTIGRERRVRVRLEVRSDIIAALRQMTGRLEPSG